MTMSRRNMELLLLAAAALPVFALYAAYLHNMSVAVTPRSLMVPICLAASFAIAHVAVRFLAPGADPGILPVTFALSGIGITFVTRLSPDAASRQVLLLLVSVALMVAVLALARDLDRFERHKFRIGIAGVLLLVAPLLPVIGRTVDGERLWVSVAGVNIQPGEFAKVALIAFFAAFFANNREVLSERAHRVGPLTFPSLVTLLPMFVVWLSALGVVAVEGDYGSALLFFTYFVIMLYIATGQAGYVIVSLLLLALGGGIVYRAIPHVAARIDIWADPFRDAQGSGYQIVQALSALANGGMTGTGIGRGYAAASAGGAATWLPAVDTDGIFAAMGEELGLLGAAAIVMCYLALAIRGVATAARAKSDLSAFMAAGLTAGIFVQAFIIIGGITKLIPLTGITLPFVSRGGTSLLANFVMIALLIRCGDEGTGRDVQMVSSQRSWFGDDGGETGVLGQIGRAHV